MQTLVSKLRPFVERILAFVFHDAEFFSSTNVAFVAASNILMALFKNFPFDVCYLLPLVFSLPHVICKFGAISLFSVAEVSVVSIVSLLERFVCASCVCDCLII